MVRLNDHESLIDPASVPAAAATAPRATMRHYPADHFEVYHSPLRERLIADQVAFLAEHLQAGWPNSPGGHATALRALRAQLDRLLPS